MTSTPLIWDSEERITSEEFAERFPRIEVAYKVPRYRSKKLWHSRCFCRCHDALLSCHNCTIPHWINMTLEEWQAQFK